MKCFIASHIVTFKIIVQFYEFFSKSYLLYFILILVYLICSFHLFNTLFHNFILFIHFTGTFSRVFHIYFLFCSFYVISHFFWFAARTNCHDKNSNFFAKTKKRKKFAPSTSACTRINFNANEFCTNTKKKIPTFFSSKGIFVPSFVTFFNEDNLFHKF